MNKESHLFLRSNPLLLEKSTSSKGIHSLLYDKDVIEDRNYKKISDFMFKVEKNREYQSFLEKQGIDFDLPVQNIQISETLVKSLRSIKGAADSRGVLKKWLDLSDSQREEAVSLLLPSFYSPHLIHEIGHNVGLRHNFYGSADFKNYSAYQPTSSIMDYARMKTDTVKYGSYDLAALKFMYGRRVELSKEYSALVGSNPQVAKQLNYNKADRTIAVTDELSKLERSVFLIGGAPGVFKEYKFCTDEDKRKAFKCAAFDKGYTYTEIIRRSIDDYKSSLKWNYRDSYPFISFGDISKSGSSRIFSYTLRRMQSFDSIRRIAATYNNAFKYDPDSFTEEDRQDILRALMMAKNFLVDTFTTPNQYCLVKQVMPDIQDQNGGQPIVNYQVELLETLYGQIKKMAEHRQIDLDPSYVPKSCFDKPIINLIESVKADQFRQQVVAYLKQQEIEPTDEILSAFTFKVAGEDGRPYRNLYKINSSPNKENKMDYDQLAVRGMWIDRLLALDMLYRVGTATPDGKYTSIRLIDIPEARVAGEEVGNETAKVRDELSLFLKHLVLPEKYSNPYPRAIIDYTASQPVQVSYDNSFTSDVYSIPMTRDNRVNYYMGVYRSSSPLMESALELVKRNRFQNDLREILVGRARSFGGVSSPEENIFKYGDYKFIVEEDNEFGNELLAYYNKSMKFSDFTQDLINKNKDQDKLEDAYATALQESVYAKDMPFESEIHADWKEKKLEQVMRLGFSSLKNLRNLVASIGPVKQGITQLKEAEKAGTVNKSNKEKSSAELEIEFDINLRLMIKKYAVQTSEYLKSMKDQVEKARAPASVPEVEKVDSYELNQDFIEKIIYNAISSEKMSLPVLDEMIDYLDTQYIPKSAGKSAQFLKGLKYEELIKIITKGPMEFYQENSRVFSRLNYLPIIQ